MTRATPATGNEGANKPTKRAVSHFMKVPTAVALLPAQHGESEARKIALTEQQRVKRARSKRRFAFWSNVAAQIESGSCNNVADGGPLPEKDQHPAYEHCSA
jgi:hypothetical protein